MSGGFSIGTGGGTNSTSGSGGSVAGNVNVSAGYQLLVQPEQNAWQNSVNMGGVRIFAENDQGLASPLGQNTNGLQNPQLLSGEVDLDFRVRMASDTMLDEETFASAVQNFTKHSLYTTAFVPTFTNSGYTTQATGTPLTTSAAASILRTYKTFSVQGTETLSADIEIGFTYGTGAALANPQVIEMGFGLGATAAPYDLFDGAYFRLSSSGAYLVMRNNSTVDSITMGPFWTPDNTATTVWQPVSGRKYQIIIYAHQRYVEVWINDPVLNLVWLAGTQQPPASLGTPFASPANNFFLRHYNGASAPAVGSYATLYRYSVRRGGSIVASSLSDITSRIAEGIYSPGTLTSTFTQSITTGSVTRPTAAVPTNTATLLNSLTGIVLETATLAVGTDGILMSYQNPALPTATGNYTQNRRIRIDGVRIGSSIQTAFTSGGFTKYFYIAYGSTSLSLQGVAADAVTTKAYRRIMLEYIQAYVTTAAVGTIPTATGPNYLALKNPIYINPGEYVALVTYHIGVVATAGVIQHHLSFDYGLE